MAKDNRFDVVIIGGGISGLTAAITCEKSGYRTLVLESETEPGGRVRSDRVEGFTLDRGFQVFIDSYAFASEILDLDALRLGRFSSGAKIIDDRGAHYVADPFRHPSKVLRTLFSGIGTLSDKLAILKLNRDLKSARIEELFENDRQSTLNYLRLRGFSDGMIETFFRPFFGGIFLERALKTPASMFRFVFRNFALGSACIPAEGMGSIPRFLVSQLSTTEVRTGTSVSSLSQSPEIILENGERIHCRKVILACDPRKLLPNMDQSLHWHGTITHYFSAPKSAPKMEGFIGLDARADSTINNFARQDEVASSLAPSHRSLWSVTLREEASPADTLKDLASALKVEKGTFEYLRGYEIQRALPRIEQPKNDLPPEQTQLTEHIHLAGDYLTNASIEGAMRAGRAAAKAVSETLEVRDEPGKIPADDDR